MTGRKPVNWMVPSDGPRSLPEGKVEIWLGMSVVIAAAVGGPFLAGETTVSKHFGDQNLAVPALLLLFSSILATALLTGVTTQRFFSDGMPKALKEDWIIRNFFTSGIWVFAIISALAGIACAIWWTPGAAVFFLKIMVFVTAIAIWVVDRWMVRKLNADENLSERDKMIKDTLDLAIRTIDKPTFFVTLGIIVLCGAYHHCLLLGANKHDTSRMSNTLLAELPAACATGDDGQPTEEVKKLSTELAGRHRDALNATYTYGTSAGSVTSVAIMANLVYWFQLRRKGDKQQGGANKARKKRNKKKQKDDDEVKQ